MNDMANKQSGQSKTNADRGKKRSALVNKAGVTRNNKGRRYSCGGKLKK